MESIPQYAGICIIRKKWAEFISMSAREPADPAFYPDMVFKELIKEHFFVHSKPTTQKDVTLTNEEANVIHYAAGYTLHTLRRTIEASSHPLKEEMVLALMELVSGEEDASMEENNAAECC